MSNYTQTTFFAPKDALLSGNPAKLIKGADVDPELAAISVAIASKFDGVNFLSHAPTALSGLTAVSGSASTWMTSDSAPAINPAIAPTWTGNHTFTPSAGVGLIVNGLAGQAALEIIGAVANSASIEYIDGRAGNRAWFVGAGVSGVGTFDIFDASAGVARLTVSSVGGVTVNAPGSGFALSITGPSGQRGTIQFTDGQAGARVWETGPGLGAAGVWGIYDSTAGLVKMNIAGGATNAITGLGPVSGTQVDMTPDTSTFTGAATGFTAGVNYSGTWYRIGKEVHLTLLSGAGGTSNSTSFTMTGLPAAIQPATGGNRMGPLNGMQVFDNGSATGTASIVEYSISGGTITFYKGGLTTGWASTGTKGLNTSSITLVYPLY